MKMFDGIHKFSINTIFGIFQIKVIDSLEHPNVVLEQITETIIKPKIPIKNGMYFNDRRFPNRISAYKYMYNLEQHALNELSDIMKKVVKNDV